VRNPKISTRWSKWSIFSLVLVLAIVLLLLLLVVVVGKKLMFPLRTLMIRRA
jgi:hypothetical protein